MIASQLSRVARATPPASICTLPRTFALTWTSAPARACCAQKLLQRRLSSSKASCPPDDGSDGTRAAASTQKAAQPARSPTKGSATKTNAPRQSRPRKSKEVDVQSKEIEAEQNVAAAYRNLPSVPRIDGIQRSGSYDLRSGRAVALRWLVRLLIPYRHNPLLLLLPPSSHQPE